MASANEGRWRVGELASATGLTVRALHHYDRLGLLVPAERTTSGQRLYDQADVRRLYRIVTLRQLGLRLDEIASVLDHGEPGIAETVRRHLGRVERDLEDQQRIRDRLIGIVETLERSREPSVDQFIDAMEAMTVLTDVAEVARVLGDQPPAGDGAGRVCSRLSPTRGGACRAARVGSPARRDLGSHPSRPRTSMEKAHGLPRWGLLRFSARDNEPGGGAVP
jgi:DNA-binding transcriptional MerR regulator